MASLMSIFDLSHVSSHSRLLKRDRELLTYKSTQGTWLQHDYLLFPQCIVAEGKSCEVVQGLANGVEAEGHLPIAATFTLPTREFKVVQHYKACNYDRSGCHDPEKAAVFGNTLEQASSIDYNVNASSHNEILLAYLWSALESPFLVLVGAKRNNVISDFHVALILRRAVLRERAKRMGTGIATSLFRATFMSRRLGCLACSCDQIRWFAKADWCWDNAFCHDAIFVIAGQIAAARLGDLADLLSLRPIILQAIISRGKNHVAFTGIKWFTKQKRQPKMRIVKQDGTMATSALDELGRFRDHNATKFRASTRRLRILLASDRTSTTTWIQNASDCNAETATIPSLPDVTRVLNKRKLHKSTSPDCLDGGITKKCCRQLAHLSHPIFLKSAIKLDTPLCWRAGRIVDPFKSGDQNRMYNFREIMLADKIGKANESFQRAGVKPILDTATINAQLGGGAKDGACDKAHLALRAAPDCAAWLKKSVAVLSLYVVGAFASLQRWMSRGQTRSLL